MKFPNIAAAVFLVIYLLLIPAFLLARIPDPHESQGACAYTGPGLAHVVALPNGDGVPFTAAWDPEGQVVDATIGLWVRDPAGYPIENFPAEDLWLDDPGGGLVSCQDGTIADADTDAEGFTQWTLPLHASGNSPDGVAVRLMGYFLQNPPLLPVSVNSPDITGDGQVTLADVGAFATDYFEGHAFRSDFNGDGNLDLYDVYWLARGLGTHCP